MPYLISYCCNNSDSREMALINDETTANLLLDGLKTKPATKIGHINLPENEYSIELVDRDHLYKVRNTIPLFKGIDSEEKIGIVQSEYTSEFADILNVMDDKNIYHWPEPKTNKVVDALLQSNAKISPSI